MNYRTHIKTGFTLTLAAVAVLGGIQGSAMQAQNLADLAAEQRVAKQQVADLALQEAHLAAEARAIISDFQPTLDGATSLIAESDGKADAESRATLAALVSAFETQTAAPFDSATAYRDAAETMTAESGAAIAAASQVVTDEVAAWQSAEDARITAEQAAAAARAAAKKPAPAPPARGGGGGATNSNNASGGGGAPSAPGAGGGTPPSSSGGSRADQWRAIAAKYGVTCFSVVPGNLSSHSNGCIEIAEGPLNAGAERVLMHEIAHFLTAGQIRAGGPRAHCGYTSRELGGDNEIYAQAYTQLYWGWSVGAYAPASQGYIDGMRNAGCL